MVEILDVTTISGELWFSDPGTTRLVVAYRIGRLIHSVGWLRIAVSLPWIDVCGEFPLVMAKLSELCVVFRPDDKGMASIIRDDHEAWERNYADWVYWLTDNPDARIDITSTAGREIVRAVSAAMTVPELHAFRLGQAVDQGARPLEAEIGQYSGEQSAALPTVDSRTGVWLGEINGECSQLGIERIEVDVNGPIVVAELDSRLRRSLESLAPLVINSQEGESVNGGDATECEPVGLLGLRVNRESRTIQRDGWAEEITLSNSDSQWQIFIIVFDAERHLTSVEARARYHGWEDDGLRETVRRLNRVLIRVCVKMTRYELVELSVDTPSNHE